MVEYIIIGFVAVVLAAIAVFVRQHENHNKKTIITKKPKNMAKEFDSNSPAVTTTLSVKAEIINRLAYNSNICKTLAVTLAGAVVSLSTTFSDGKLIFVLLALLILCLLDALFMGMKKQQQTVSKVIVANSKSNTPPNPYDEGLKSGGGKCDAIQKGLCSITILPFYITISVGTILAYIFN